jgi:hypothetical protein
MSIGYLVFIGDDECGRPDYIQTVPFKTKLEAVDYIIDCVYENAEANVNTLKKLISWMTHPNKPLKVGISIYEIRFLTFEHHPYQRKTVIPDLFDRKDVSGTITKSLTYLEKLNNMGTEKLYFPEVTRPDDDEEDEFDGDARASKIAVTATSDLAARAMFFLLRDVINKWKGLAEAFIEDSNVIFISEFVEYIAGTEKCSDTKVKIQPETEIWTVAKIRASRL